MADKRLLDFKLEMAKLEGVVDELKKQLQDEIERKRALNSEKIALITQGNKRKEVQALNKQLQELNQNVLFIQEEIEIMKEHIAEVKQEKVMELIEYRSQKFEEMKAQRKDIEEELHKVKMEYLSKVHEIAGLAMWDMKRDLWDLNDVIREYGDSTKMKQPRLLLGLELPEFSAPRPTDGESLFVMKHELEQALRG